MNKIQILELLKPENIFNENIETKKLLSNIEYILKKEESKEKECCINDIYFNYEENYFDVEIAIDIYNKITVIDKKYSLEKIVNLLNKFHIQIINTI